MTVRFSWLLIGRFGADSVHKYRQVDRVAGAPGDGRTIKPVQEYLVITGSDGKDVAVSCAGSMV